MARLIITDDHGLVAEALRERLARRHEVVGVAGDGDALLALLERRDADCLLLDLSMPGHNGLDVIPQVLRLAPSLPIVVVTMFCDRAMADAALAAGAMGFVPKSAPMGELDVAIGSVLAGQRYVSPSVPKSSHRVGLAARRPGLHHLTPRQQQILLLMGQGRSATDIGASLHLSASTITFHKQNLMRALGVRSDSELRRYAALVATTEDAPPSAPARRH